MQVFVLCYILSMRLHRFYLNNLNKNKIIVTQETDLIHQLKNVFRYKIGQRIFLFNEKDGEGEFEIVDINKKDMSFKFIRQIKNIEVDDKNKRQVTLCMSVIKNNNFDLVLEKAVELGVSKIIPINTERVIKGRLNYERLNKIIKESTEQSGRIDLMKLVEIINLDDLIKTLSKYKADKYFGHITKKDQNISIFNNTTRDIFIIIGPEGGFTENEINNMIESGIKPICISDNVLRAETAAILFSGLFNL